MTPDPQHLVYIQEKPMGEGGFSSTTPDQVQSMAGSLPNACSVINVVPCYILPGPNSIFRKDVPSPNT